MKAILKIFKSNKEILYNLIINDFKSRFTGSYLGIIWGFVQPIITIIIYWFVFQVGLKSGDRPDGTPFIIWMIIGMLPWFFISDAMGATTSTFVDYSYLVKKVNLHIGLLPLVRIGSALINHSVFIVFTTLILNFYGYQADWNYLQLLYYIVAAIYFSLGIGYLTASLTVFFRDMTQIMAILIQIGFWIIPIVWGPEILTNNLSLIFKLNPIYYVVEGFRDTLLAGRYFWYRPVETLYFWIITTIVLFVSYKVYRKLKPNFADVL